MKARIFTGKTAPALEQQLQELVGVAHIGYAIDPKGQHHALVLLDETGAKRGTVAKAADRFISDALSTGESAR